MRIPALASGHFVHAAEAIGHRGIPQSFVIAAFGECRYSLNIDPRWSILNWHRQRTTSAAFGLGAIQPSHGTLPGGE